MKRLLFILLLITGLSVSGFSQYYPHDRNYPREHSRYDSRPYVVEQYFDGSIKYSNGYYGLPNGEIVTYFEWRRYEDRPQVYEPRRRRGLTIILSSKRREERRANRHHHH